MATTTDRAKPKRKPATLAARLFEQLATLDARIATAEQAVVDRKTEREDLIKAASPDVRELVERMRAPAPNGSGGEGKKAGEK